ncbi:hypothetical protein CKN99_16515 [Carnobacterium maltaromaticum]|nr:hypothetical protein CKN88_16540 [Carnobacterium maltaromaticum]TFJ33800.1 hypothetical protein CKN99_16515 [Carnobacterium maltaromaticum]
MRKKKRTKFLKGALTQTQKFGYCKQKKWIWSTTFFFFCEQSHMLACARFLVSTDKKMCRWKLFFGFPQSHQTEISKNHLTEFTKNKKRHWLKIRNMSPCCSACKTKIVRQKNCQRLESTLDFFPFAPLTFVNV